MQNTNGVQSPPFGYLSPPIDVNDTSSDDGDTLQTPLTEHDEQHQPYAVFHQHHFSHDLFRSDGHPERADSFNHHTTTRGEGSSFSSFPNLLTPPAREKLDVSRGHSQLDSYFPPFSPSYALDLANASLEFNLFSNAFAPPFHSSHVLSHNAQPFTPSRETFDFLAEAFSPPGPSQSDTSDFSLGPLPSMSISTDTIDDLDVHRGTPPSLLLTPDHHSHLPAEDPFMVKGRVYSPRFPAEHLLNHFFVRSYQLGDELGAGGYGFVMTATHRTGGYEVAVKFIIKDKVPDHAWWEDDMLGRVPTEVMVMSLISHDNIVKCLDIFEDDRYFYLVQELHGTPWVSKKKGVKQITAPGKLVVPCSSGSSTPQLTPSPSTESNGSLPPTPPQVHTDVNDDNITDSHLSAILECLPQASSSPSLSLVGTLEPNTERTEQCQGLLQPPPPRPNFSRRPSYDLFECIEQSKHKRLSENCARYIFAQVVEAVHYLDSQGITHCDIKDENLVVDSDFKVKLIDFGSAVVADPFISRPYYTLFFGTTAYASSEILRKQPYQAAPAEIWTLGVLLSYLLTGHSPFPSEQDAIDGRVVMRERGGAGRLSRAALALMGRCLERDPERRADIAEVRGHRWLQGALDRENLQM